MSLFEFIDKWKSQVDSQARVMSSLCQRVLRGIATCFGVVLYLCLQPVAAEIPPPPLVPLVDRDPCEEPKLFYCTKPTDFVVGKYHLSIPFNLIGQRSPANDLIELVAIWPGLVGKLKPSSPKGKFDHHDTIHILIQTLRPERPTEEGVRDLLKFLNLAPPITLANLGLLEYRNPRAKNEVWAYIPIDQNGLLPNKQPLYIHTGGPSTSGDVGTIECEFGYTVRDGLYVIVRFSRRHIDDWRAITTMSRDLVESFFNGVK